MSAFNDLTQQHVDWRAPAVKSAELAKMSEKKEYAYIARAQDQEDIWLYENWFYGMEGNNCGIVYSI
jgi:hypothetical protein